MGVKIKYKLAIVNYSTDEKTLLLIHTVTETKNDTTRMPCPIPLCYS